MADCLSSYRDFNRILISLEVKSLLPGDIMLSVGLGLWSILAVPELPHLLFISGHLHCSSPQLVLHSIHVSAQRSPPPRSLRKHPNWHSAVLTSTALYFLIWLIFFFWCTLYVLLTEVSMFYDNLLTGLLTLSPNVHKLLWRPGASLASLPGLQGYLAYKY